MATYSNNIPEWDGTETLAGNQVGWNMQVWEALVDTITEPSLTNTDWTLISVGDFAGFTLLETHERGNTPLSEVEFGGITLLETHVNKVDEIEFSALTMREYIPQPDYPSILTPNYITNIRVYTNNLKGRQLNTENKLTNN